MLPGEMWEGGRVLEGKKGVEKGGGVLEGWLICVLCVARMY